MNACTNFALKPPKIAARRFAESANASTTDRTRVVDITPGIVLGSGRATKLLEMMFAVAGMIKCSLSITASWAEAVNNAAKSKKNIAFCIAHRIEHFVDINCIMSKTDYYVGDILKELNNCRRKQERAGSNLERRLKLILKGVTSEILVRQKCLVFTFEGRLSSSYSKTKNLPHF